MDRSSHHPVDPLVSVVIPVYNGERYLSQALDSVLAQEYARVEIIVVDDGSTDGSADIARGYQTVRYLYQANAGPAAARNTGIGAASGEFIAFLDHDDVWEPWKLRTEIECFRDHPELGYTIARGRFVYESDMESPNWAITQRGDGNPVPLHAALVARRSLFDQIGLLDPTFRVAEDTEWLMRANDAHIPMMVLDGALLRRRIHETNASNQVELARIGVLRAVRNSMHRQRLRRGPDSAEEP
jgi:glycosyltransferase involved in cell wall biosynthesis